MMPSFLASAAGIVTDHGVIRANLGPEQRTAYVRNYFSDAPAPRTPARTLPRPQRIEVAAPTRPSLDRTPDVSTPAPTAVRGQLGLL